MASKGRKGQWGWYIKHTFSYCHSFHNTKVKYFEKLSFHMSEKLSEKDQMQVLLRVDSHPESITAGLKWAGHPQKPITALIFIFSGYLCQNIFSYLLQNVLVFITVLLKVYLITFECNLLLYIFLLLFIFPILASSHHNFYCVY